MNVDICLEANDRQRLLDCQTVDEVLPVAADILYRTGGPCKISIAALAGLSTGVLYKIANGYRPSLETLLALIGVLAPGHRLTIIAEPPARRACIAKPAPRVFAWAAIEGHLGFERELIDGKPTGFIRDQHGRRYDSKGRHVAAVAITTTRVNADVDHAVAAE